MSQWAEAVPRRSPLAIQVVLPPPEGALDALVDHVRSIVAGGSPVLYLAADRPAGVLDEAFRSGGVPSGRVHFLDAVTSLGTSPPQGAANVTFVPSPTMLEIIAMRLEQLAQRLGRPYVILDSLSTLALYAGPLPVQQFSHYVANRLRARGLKADFLVGDSAEGRQLAAQVAGYADRQGTLGVPL